MGLYAVLETEEGGVDEQLLFRGSGHPCLEVVDPKLVSPEAECVGSSECIVRVVKDNLGDHSKADGVIDVCVQRSRRTRKVDVEADSFCSKGVKFCASLSGASRNVSGPQLLFVIVQPAVLGCGKKGVLPFEMSVLVEFHCEASVLLARTAQVIPHIIENGLLVPWMDECGERHPVKDIDVVLLVRLGASPFGALNFKHRPAVFVEDDQIRNTLKISRVVLEYPAPFIAQLADEFGLELTFEQLVLLSGQSLRSNVIGVWTEDNIQLSHFFY